MTDTKNWAIAIVAFCTILTSTGQLLFKKGLNILEPTIIGIATNNELISGLVLYIIGAILMVIALKYGELSVLYPIVALSFVWVAILSSLFLQEQITELKIAGIGMIILGVSAIGKGSKKQGIKLR